MPVSAPALPQRYRSPELLASGGMADVYRAADELLGREVAVKVLAATVSADPEFRMRFVREARMAATLSGARHVVTIFDVGELEDGRPYIVMEYLRGGSLADRLRGEPVQPARALEWLGQAADGLDAAHAAGIVHRDVKPGNLLLTGEEEIRVTDFGIARATGADPLTATGTIMGTSGYMAPEQVRGERATAASDRYGLAVVAFELLAGRRPFGGDSQVTEALAHVSAPVPRATALNRDLPRLVDAALAKGLDKDPAARPESCGALVESLRRAFHDSAGETGRMRAAAVPVPRARQRNRARLGRPAAIALLVAVAVAGVALASAVSSGEPRQATRTVVRTETVAGVAQTRTVTVETAAAAPAADTGDRSESAPETPATTDGEDGAALNDAGYRRLQDGDIGAALPLLERAVRQLAGTGSLAEAYASYNLALARLGAGRCDGVLELLDRSESVQGKRREINRLRKDARKTCGR